MDPFRVLPFTCIFFRGRCPRLFHSSPSGINGPTIRVHLFPGALPPAISFIPFGDSQITYVTAQNAYQFIDVLVPGRALKGHQVIAGGNAPGKLAHPTRPTLKGSHCPPDETTCAGRALKGHQVIAGGNAPGKLAHPTRPTLKGSHCPPNETTCAGRALQGRQVIAGGNAPGNEANQTARP